MANYTTIERRRTSEPIREKTLANKRSHTLPSDTLRSRDSVCRAEVDHVISVSSTRATRDRESVVDRLPRASVAALAKWPSIDDDKDLGA